MALESLFVRVTNSSSGDIFLADVNQGLSLESAARARRPGPVYVGSSSSVNLALDSSVLLSYESGDIRQQVDAGNMSVSLLGGTTQVLTYLYDFSSDGGAVGNIVLGDIAGSAKVLPASILLRGWVHVVTAPTSGGSATVAIGTAADRDGFLPATAIASLTAGSVTPFAGALVENGTDSSAPVELRQAAAGVVSATVAAAALTAGKFYVHLECLPLFS